MPWQEWQGSAFSTISKGESLYTPEIDPQKPNNPGDCLTAAAPAPLTHFIGFRDDRYWNAVAIWGRPHFIHRWWDKRAARDIHPDDTVIFAEGDWRQEPSRYNAPDIDEAALGFREVAV